MLQTVPEIYLKRQGLIIIVTANGTDYISQGKIYLVL